MVSSLGFKLARLASGVALVLALALPLCSSQPSSAATAGQVSTRNIILAATAVTLGIVLYNNLEHKTVTQTTVVGHTSDGGAVYGDGRILYPGGVVVYASNDGIHMCAYFGVGVRCGAHAVGHPWRYEDSDDWHGKGLHKGWNKGEGNPHHEGGDGDDNDQGHGHGHQR